MFAYPSGSLHMGHLRVYTISDVLARFRQMQGLNVLHPTGWDAFGLPAENAAIERGIDPARWTLDNIDKMREQLKSMNTSFAWDAELSTSSPEFYKFTQMLFLKLFEKGLAYQAEATVNWDPVDKTVLANEQVDSQGRSWRSGAVVELRKLRQWFFKITDYAEALHRGLDFLAEGNKWPERVLTQQLNWLGRSTGSKIVFPIIGSEATTKKIPSIQVFTTRADTIFGVKYIALSNTHPLVLEYAALIPELKEFLNSEEFQNGTSKAGFRLPVQAVLPTSPESRLPIFVAPYVLADYGEGAVMGVPAHDSRDLAFWKENLQGGEDGKLPIVVINPDSPPDQLLVAASELEEAQTGHGVLSNLCGTYAGTTSEAAILKLQEDLPDYIQPALQWRLRDWLVSRQRYWGTPIPIIHCEACGVVPVPPEDLPVCLPSIPEHSLQTKGNILESHTSWHSCKCPKCSGPAKRETDTMDTFVDSSWYYARFPDAHNTENFVDKDIADKMLPVDTYIGGVEHAILHLLYARFIYKFMAEEGIVPVQPRIGQDDGSSTWSARDQEPFLQLIAQGMVHGKTYSDPETGRFLRPHEIKVDGGKVLVAGTERVANESWEKMSKSKYNGVDPAECIAKYGADATRAHVLFAAPVSEVLQWDEQKIIGIQRWFRRVQRVVDKAAQAPVADHTLTELLPEEVVHFGRGHILVSSPTAKLLLLTQDTVRTVTETLSKNMYNLNTVVSDLIKLTNALDEASLEEIQIKPSHFQLMAVTLVKLLGPIAPAFAEECWETIGAAGSSVVGADMWPKPILPPIVESALRGMNTQIKCAVQVNGKLRFTATVPKIKVKDDGKGPVDEEEQGKLLEAILKTEEGRLWLTERNRWEERKKVVVVKGGQLVNIVF
ncbi:hypothetical protein DV738_g2436, partial [Chaetothyriales sp. CBS 135597]